MNIEKLNTQIEYLKETKNLIKEQLIAKGQPVDDNTTFREYVDNMIDLIDTTDADAIDSDIVENKTAYVNGQKVTGTLEIVDAISIDNSDNTDTNLMLMNIGNIPSIVVGADINDLYGDKKVVEDGVGLEIIAPQSQFADVIGLTTDKIKQGETILGVAGSVVELNGDTETVTPTTSQQIITPTSPKNGLTQVTVNAVTSAIDSNIKTENIKRGVTILGISGKSSVVDTSDANAVANDIVDRKKAYVNGNKITGTMYHFGGMVQSENYNRAEATSYRVITNGTPKQVIFNCDVLNSNQYIPAGNYVQVFAILDDFNSYIGLTADKLKVGETVLGVAGSVVELNGETASVTPTTSQQTIVPTGTDKNALTEVTVNAVTSAIDNNIQAGNIKSGVTILGVQGTYAGSTMKEYASVTDMNNDIVNIAEGELVKVVASGVTTYYIKETISGTATMTKLVKESETISPQDFEEAEDQIGDLFGEGENN